MVNSKEINACYNSAYNKDKGVYNKYGVELECVYEEMESESAILKLEKKIDFNLSVKFAGNNIYAFINIKNRGAKSIYIWRGDLYSFGNELSGDFFNIITDNIRLDYLGVKVNFGGRPDSISDYISIAPNGEINEKIKLNSYYQFLSEEHLYDIGTNYIAFTYKPLTGDEYYSNKTAIWIRSNRQGVLINGATINDKLAMQYGVK